MGILDLHFHDSEFTFAPSATMSSTDSDEADTSKKSSRLGFGRSRSKPSESATEESTKSTEMSASEESDESSGGSKAKKGLSVIVGLAFLVAIAVMAKKRRGGQETEDMGTDEYGSESVEESIEISD